MRRRQRMTVSLGQQRKASRALRLQPLNGKQRNFPLAAQISGIRCRLEYSTVLHRAFVSLAAAPSVGITPRGFARRTEPPLRPPGQRGDLPTRVPELRFPPSHDTARYRTIQHDMLAKPHDTCAIPHDSSTKTCDFNSKSYDSQRDCLICVESRSRKYRAKA
jgi:hypothetical protein